MSADCKACRNYTTARSNLMAYSTYNTPEKALLAKYACTRCSADLKVKAQRCKQFNIAKSDVIDCYKVLRNANGSFVDADNNVKLIEVQGVRNKWWPAKTGGAATQAAAQEWTVTREKNGKLVAYPAKSKKRHSGGTRPSRDKSQKK